MNWENYGFLVNSVGRSEKLMDELLEDATPKPTTQKFSTFDFYERTAVSINPLGV